jgi:hypothetical protein
MALMGCKNCTVMDGRIGGNMGHSGYINLGAGTHNLFLRLHAGRQMHAFSMQNAPCGTVFCDCTADEPAGLDLHGGIGLDTLYDCLHGCVNAGGGAPSAVPPRHSHGLVLWNWEQGRYNPYKEWRTVPSITSWVETPGFIAVGVRGQDGHRVCYKSPDGVAWDNVDAPWGVVESINQEVGPRSLWAWMRARKRA